MANDQRSLGPECAVLTSIGTVYLYRITAADLRAFRELPATQLSIDKFRVLLSRIASLHVSEKGILDAASLTRDQVESLTDDEVERLAESYLDGTTVRWYRHEGASATLSVIRSPNESAATFLDRLIHWFASRGPGRLHANGDGLSATMPPRPRPAPAAAPATVSISRREAWIALGALALLALLGIGAFLQHYFVVQSLQRQQEALVTQVKETNALIASYAARVDRENAELRGRIDAMEAALRARPTASRPAPKPETPAKSPSATPKKRKAGATRDEVRTREQLPRHVYR